jgi:hypothetical protein
MLSNAAAGFYWRFCVPMLIFNRDGNYRGRPVLSTIRRDFLTLALVVLVESFLSAGEWKTKVEVLT